ncbi:phosphatidylserine decarboxylase, partial [Acinetobacter baumannii]
KVEHPWVRDLSIGLWRRFGEVDLSDARKTQFRSLHDAFIRELRDGARPLDPRPDVLVSPCDAIVGALGRIEGDTLLQAKGMCYTL